MNHKEKNPWWGYVIAYFIVLPLVAWINCWENWVWIRWPISYWQMFWLTIPLMLFPKGIKTYIFGSITAIACLAQVASWFR